MRPPTPRQLEVHAWMLAYQTQHGVPPAIREIAVAFGFTSKSGVTCHLDALAGKGLLRRPPNATRGWIAVPLPYLVPSLVTAVAPIDVLRDVVRRLDATVGAYHLVELDIAKLGAGHPGVEFVVGARQRAEVELARAHAAIATEQAACSHAFERIGEARPPFQRCVRCGVTRSDEPWARTA